MKITRKSNGQLKTDLTSLLALKELNIWRDNAPVSVPAVVRDSFLIFDIERSLETIPDRSVLTSQEVSAGARLMLDLLGAAGQLETVRSQADRARITMGDEVRQQILNQFVQQTDWSASTANYVLDVVVDGVERTFRSQLSNLFIKNRLLEIEDPENENSIIPFNFDDIQATLDFGNRVYASLLKETDITSVMELLRTYLQNPVIHNVMALMNIVYDSTGPSVNVAKGQIIENIAGMIDFVGVTTTVDSAVTNLQTLSIDPTLSQITDGIGASHMLGFLLDIMEMWSGTQMEPAAGRDVYEIRRLQAFMPINDLMTESETLDYHALRPYMQSGDMRPQLERLFNYIYVRHLISAVLSRELGSFQNSLSALLTTRKQSSEMVFQNVFDRYTKALSISRHAYQMTFATLRGLVSAPDVMFFDVAPAVARKLHEVFESFVGKMATFYSTGDEARFPRAVSHLLNMRPMLDLISDNSYPTQIESVGYFYHDRDISYDGSAWINNDETGARRLHVVGEPLVNRDGYRAATIMRAPVENLRPLLTRFSIRMQPFFYMTLPFDARIDNFVSFNQEAIVIPVRHLKARNCANFFASRAKEIMMFESLKHMSRFMHMPVEWVEAFLIRAEATWDEPWYVMSKPEVTLILDRTFKFFEVGKEDPVDRRNWPFIGSYPFYNLWEDQQYIIDDAYYRTMSDSMFAFAGSDKGVAASVPVTPVVTASELKEDISIIEHFEQQAANFLGASHDAPAGPRIDATPTEEQPVTPSASEDVAPMSE